LQVAADRVGTVEDEAVAVGAQTGFHPGAGFIDPAGDGLGAEAVKRVSGNDAEAGFGHFRVE